MNTNHDLESLLKDCYYDPAFVDHSIVGDDLIVRVDDVCINLSEFSQLIARECLDLVTESAANCLMKHEFIIDHEEYCEGVETVVDIINQMISQKFRLGMDDK